MTEDDLQARLRGVWADVLVDTARPLTGGFWATMHRVSVTGQPPGVPADLVVRAAPHAAMGAKEAEVQRSLASQGFSTPAVHVSRPDEATGGWWSVMDFVDGTPLLAGLDGLAVLRRAPALARTLPTQLASAMAALHAHDVQSVVEVVGTANADVAWTPRELLERFRAGAAALGRADLLQAIDDLVGTMPAPGREVLCHGDLHPFNVLELDDGLVVLDWTGALVADPCFDVAFTELLLANPPLQLPGPLAPIGAAAGRLLARRFLAAYQRANPVADLTNLAWYRALHGARVLLELANLEAVHGPDAGGHPFLTVAPAARRHLAALAVTVPQP